MHYSVLLLGGVLMLLKLPDWELGASIKFQKQIFIPIVITVVVVHIRGHIVNGFYFFSQVKNKHRLELRVVLEKVFEPSRVKEVLSIPYEMSVTLVIYLVATVTWWSKSIIESQHVTDVLKDSNRILIIVFKNEFLLSLRILCISWILPYELVTQL